MQVLTRPPPLSVGGGAAEGTYWIRTFGCQMNLADTERMAGVLETMGYVNTTDPDTADVLVYNTCSIRDKAEQKVYSALGRQAKRKRENPNLKIVVAGCVAQQEGETLLRRVPEVDLVMGPQFANRIDQLLDAVDQGQQVCSSRTHTHTGVSLVMDVLCGWVPSECVLWTLVHPQAVYDAYAGCTRNLLRRRS